MAKESAFLELSTKTENISKFLLIKIFKIKSIYFRYLMQKVRRFNINKNMKTVIIKVNILNILKMERFNSKVKE
jgi:hypothetical protein